MFLCLNIALTEFSYSSGITTKSKFSLISPERKDIIEDLIEEGLHFSIFELSFFFLFDLRNLEVFLCYKQYWLRISNFERRPDLRILFVFDFGFE